MKKIMLTYILVLHVIATNAFILKTLNKTPVFAYFMSQKNASSSMTYSLNSDKNEQDIKNGAISSTQSQIAITELIFYNVQSKDFTIKMPIANLNQIVADFSFTGSAALEAKRKLSKEESKSLESPDAYVLIIPDIHDPKKPRIVLPLDTEYKMLLEQAAKESKQAQSTEVSQENRLNALEGRVQKIETFLGIR